LNPEGVADNQWVRLIISVLSFFYHYPMAKSRIADSSNICWLWLQPSTNVQSTTHAMYCFIRLEFLFPIDLTF